MLPAIPVITTCCAGQRWIPENLANKITRPISALLCIRDLALQNVQKQYSDDFTTHCETTSISLTSSECGFRSSSNFLSTWLAKNDSSRRMRTRPEGNGANTDRVRSFFVAFSSSLFQPVVTFLCSDRPSDVFGNAPYYHALHYEHAPNVYAPRLDDSHTDRLSLGRAPVRRAHDQG